MPQNNIRAQNQSGNVFIIILVAIFLFGALMFTFSRSGSQGVSSISKQEAKIIASNVINYGSTLSNCVDKVRRTGCSETEISFEGAEENLVLMPVGTYINPNSPADKSCHVFNDNGGKCSIATHTKLFSGKAAASPYNSFNSKTDWDGNGIADLYWGLELPTTIGKTICEEINKSAFGNSTIPTTAIWLADGFANGNFAKPAIAHTIPNLVKNKEYFCAHYIDGRHLFYQKLLQR